MEQENRLEQNRYSKPFVGLGTAQEADSFIARNDKEKPNICLAATKVSHLMETFMREKQNKTNIYHNINRKRANGASSDSLVVIHSRT